MEYKNILLNLSVNGSWKSAIDEAYDLAKKLNMGVSLNYTNQHQFIILPTVTQDNIEKIKQSNIVIGW